MYISLHLTVIKPGPARRINPGPGSWTGSGLLKDRPVQRPGGSTHDPGDPGEPGRDPTFWSWIRLRWLQFASRSGFEDLEAFPCFASKQGRIHPFEVDQPSFFCLFKDKHYCLPKQNQRAFAGCLFTHSFTKRWLRAGNQVLKAFFFLVVVALCRDSYPLLSFIQIGTGFERLWILSRLHFLESMFSI
jgi:hypothetical protein